MLGEIMNQVSSQAGTNTNQTSENQPNQAQAQTQTQTQNQSQTSSPSWFGEVDPETRAWIESKKFSTPAEAIKSHRELETMMGAPKEQILRLNPQDPKSITDAFLRLGKPENAEGYEIEPLKKAAPEFAKTISQKLFEMNFTKDQANGLINFMVEQENVIREENKKAKDEMVSRIQSDLRKEYGTNFEANMDLAKRALKQFGVDTETPDGESVIDGIGAVIGSDKAIRLFIEVGKRMSEDTMRSTHGSQSTISSNAAKEQIESLRKDTDFVKKLVSGDSEANRRLEALYKSAYPS